MHAEGHPGHPLVGEHVVERVLDLVDHQDGRLHLAAASAGGAGLAGVDLRLGAHPLAGELDDAETRGRQDVVLGLVVGHGLLEGLVQRTAVLGAVEVDEVDGDDAAHVAQPKQPGDLLGRLDVDLQGVLLLVLLPPLAAAAVHVHHVHGLGLLDHEAGAAGQRDLPSEGLLDLLVDAEGVEDAALALEHLHDVLLVRGVLLQELAHLLGQLVVVHVDGAEVLVQHIAQHGAGPVDLAQHPLGGTGIAQVAVAGVPTSEQGLQVGVQLGHLLVLGVGADDEAEVGGLDAPHQPLQAVALLLVLDPAADADLVGEGHQHHVPARQRHFRGEARALGADGLLGDLHQHVLAGAHHVGDLAALVDVGLQRPVLQQRVLHRAVHRALGVLVAVAVLGTEVEVVQEGVLLMPHVHEGGVEAGGHLAHPGQVHVAHGEAPLGLLAVQFGQQLVLQDRDGDLGVVRTDDELVAHRFLRWGWMAWARPQGVRNARHSAASPNVGARHGPSGSLSLTGTSSCGGSSASASCACAWPSYGASSSFRKASCSAFSLFSCITNRSTPLMIAVSVTVLRYSLNAAMARSVLSIVA